MNLINDTACICLLDIITFGLLTVINTDIAVKRLYSIAHEAWEAIGSPVGFIWVPPKTTVKDTLTICGRRIGISEIYKRIRSASGHEKAIYIIQGYYRFHKITVAMIIAGLLCFISVLLLSFFN